MTGHTMAKGATAVAAYDPFRPFLPEPYTSPGGDIPVFFDSDGNRYRQPQIRRVPQVAGADRGNTTFFAADDLRDSDTLPNFGGTSAVGTARRGDRRAGAGQGRWRKSLTRRGRCATGCRTRRSSTTSTRWSLGGSADGADGHRAGRAGQRELHGPPESMVDPKFFTLKYSGRLRRSSP